MLNPQIRNSMSYKPSIDLEDTKEIEEIEDDYSDWYHENTKEWD